MIPRLSSSTLSEMTLSFDSEMSHTASRTQHRLKQIAIRKMEHASTIYHKMDQSLPRTAEYLQQEQALVEKRRAKKYLTRAQRQTQSVVVTEHDDVTSKKKTSKKINTAHTPDVDPITGLTWQEKRQQRQYRRQQQQQQLTPQWAEKIDTLMEAHVPERLILPLLRKYEGDVDAILAYHAAYHQQRVAMKHRQQQQRIKKSYADTVLVRSCAAEEQMMLAHDAVESGHIRDIALV